MGDEYTPTTAEVRAFYTAETLDGPHLDGFPLPTADDAEAQFDRWLREHDATVLESARNRLNGHDPAGEQLQRMADEKRSS